MFNKINFKVKTLPDTTAELVKDVYGITEGTTDIIRDYILPKPLQDMLNGVLTYDDVVNEVIDDDKKIPTSKAVYDFVRGLPAPMHYIGGWHCEFNDPFLEQPSIARAGEVYTVIGNATRFNIVWSDGDVLVFDSMGYVLRWDINNPAVANKLDKVVISTQYNQVYGKTTAGSQIMFNSSGANVPGSIVERDSLGNVQFNAPTIAKHGVNKEWAEDNFVPLRDTVTTNHEAYVKYADGTQGFYVMSTGGVGSSIVVRNVDGYFDVKAPTNASQPTNRGYVDNNFVVKVTATSSYPELYGKQANGNQLMYPTTPNAIGNSIVYRDANSTFLVGNPTSGGCVTPRDYVDNKVATTSTMLNTRTFNLLSDSDITLSDRTTMLTLSAYNSNKVMKSVTIPVTPDMYVYQDDALYTMVGSYMCQVHFTPAGVLTLYMDNLTGDDTHIIVSEFK